MVSLKVTTDYSFLKSLIKISDLISFLIKNNINSCGICDDELFGSMEFYLKCKENNIKPIIGLDIIINNYHVYLYPKNYLGYKKLLKINTLKNERSLEIIDILDDTILIVLPYESLDLDMDYKNNNIYLGYYNNASKKSVSLLSENIIYIKTIRCLNQTDVPYLEYLLKLGGKFSLKEDSYFEINISKEDENKINEFIKQIDLVLPFNQKLIPKYKENIDSYAYLERLANTGLSKRLYNNVDSKYKNRLDSELKIIKDMGFVDYFLIVYDYVLFAKKNKIIVGPGRGSAVGSLVSYAIGITDIDPLKYDLLFSRFLNPYRKKMPDIDIDFEDTRRIEVIEYVKEKYGINNVAVGVTFNSYKSKLILRDLAKVLNIDNHLIDKFVREIDSRKGLIDNKNNPNIRKYLEMYKELNALYDIAIHLENIKKNISIHAAGVVISNISLDEIIPIYKEDNLIRTGISLDYMEKIGLLKMDFLSVKNLTFLKEVLIKIPNLDLKNIDLNDDNTLKLFQKANTDNIFQFESSYAKEALRKLQVSNFNELIIAIAFLRPGANNQMEEYLNNKNNGYKIDSRIKDILDETKGIIIYQEQVMKLLQVVASYTEFESDTARVAISKKNEELIKNEKDHFYKGARNNKYDEDFINDLWQKIVKFAEYGFNKSHSVSYAQIAYNEAYLKANYNIEFNLTLLEDNKDLVSKKNYINELKKDNIKVLFPNINLSTKEYKLQKMYLLLPINIINNINDDIINNIIIKRKNGFIDIFDFILKCNKFINEDTFKKLVFSKIFDVFKITKQTLINNIDSLYNYAALDDPLAEKPLLVEYPEYDIDYLREKELEVYGFYIGNHPCSMYSKYIKINSIEKYLFKKVDVAVLIEKITTIKTKKNEQMAFVLVSDETGQIEATVFPKNYCSLNDIKNNDVVFINANVSKRFDKVQIIVNNIKRKGIKNE